MRPRCSEESVDSEPGTKDEGRREESIYVSMNGLKVRREETAEKEEQKGQECAKVGTIAIYPFQSVFKNILRIYFLNIALFIEYVYS